MNTVKRRTRSDAGRRTFGGRTLVALVAAAALTLGPGALAAYADDSAPPEETAPAVVELAPEAPPVDPAPAPEPPAPAPEPPAPAPPAPAPEQPLPPEQPSVEENTVAPQASTALEEPEPAEEIAAAEEEVKPGDDNPEMQIKLCHATGSETNPWVMIMINANGVVSGHGSHEGDIIPSFEYKEKGEWAYYPGQNLTDENVAIWENDCMEVPPPPPDEMIKLCHATGSENNPWVMLVINVNGVINGHAKHEGDIIPSFEYMEKGEWAYYPGQNLTPENIAIWENDCEEIAPPPPPPPPPASVTPVVTIASVPPALPITSSPQALAVTGSSDNGSGLAAGILLLLVAGSALLATGARRAMKLRG